MVRSGGLSQALWCQQCLQALGQCKKISIRAKETPPKCLRRRSSRSETAGPDMVRSPDRFDRCQV
eukprot:175206-Prorocentrum_lima.AAC.1